MAPNNGMHPLPADVAEEIRRQLASAKDVQLSSEVGQRNETVLSNIMLPGQKLGQMTPAGESASHGSNFTGETPKAEALKAQDYADGGHAKAAHMHSPNPGSTQFSPAGSSTALGNTNTSDIPPAPMAEPALSTVQPAGLHAENSSQSERATPIPQEPVAEVEAPPVNHDPLVTGVIPDQTTLEDSGFSFTIPPASFTDVDAGDHLSFTATLADGSPLPAWLVFDPITQAFSGTPVNDDVGEISIKVTATDDSGASAAGQGPDDVDYHLEDLLPGLGLREQEAQVGLLLAHHLADLEVLVRDRPGHCPDERLALGDVEVAGSDSRVGLHALVLELAVVPEDELVQGVLVVRAEGLRQVAQLVLGVLLLLAVRPGYGVVERGVAEAEALLELYCHPDSGALDVQGVAPVQLALEVVRDLVVVAADGEGLESVEQCSDCDRKEHCRSSFAHD